MSDCSLIPLLQIWLIAERNRYTRFSYFVISRHLVCFVSVWLQSNPTASDLADRRKKQVYQVVYSFAYSRLDKQFIGIPDTSKDVVLPAVEDVVYNHIYMITNGTLLAALKHVLNDKCLFSMKYTRKSFTHEMITNLMKQQQLFFQGTNTMS